MGNFNSLPDQNTSAEAAGLSNLIALAISPSASFIVKTGAGIFNNVTLVAGANVTITSSGSTVTISSTGGGGGGSGTPGGIDKNIQYNNAGVFGGITNNVTATKKYLQQVSAGIPSFQQIAVADLSDGVTGSGAIVLGTSPTITTAVLNGTVTGTSVSQSSSSLTLVQRDGNSNAFANNFIFNSTATVSSGATTTLTSASSRMQILTGSSAQTYQLPNATTMNIGATFEFNNNSTGVLTVNDAGGNLVTTIPAGGYSRVTCTNVSSSNGVWDKHFLISANGSYGTAGVIITGTLNVSGHLTFESVTSTGATGTGKLVFDTSPTFTTPVLGTPTSGTLTNCTGLPLSTGVTGQLPLANGGTNANLTASNGGIFYSTASAGAILAGTATANKVLMSGSSAAPLWSTPTYPNASATSGKIITSDGTNFIASAYTVASPGTSGNVLTSDGTNWTSAAPASSTPLIVPSVYTFETSAAYTFNNTNGTQTYDSTGLLIATSGTSGSYASVKRSIGGTGVLDTKSIFATSAFFTARVGITNVANITGTSFIGFGVVTVAGTGHTYTTKHVGVKINNAGSANATATLTVADGTTEATTTISSAVAQNDIWDFYIVINSANLVTCYFRQNFGAQSSVTVATNIPSGTGNESVQFSVSNNSTANNYQLNIQTATYYL